MHRGYTSEPGGHAKCPFEFYQKWVNDPEGLRDEVEALTRDADSPAKATTPKIKAASKPKLKVKAA